MKRGSNYRPGLITVTEERREACSIEKMLRKRLQTGEGITATAAVTYNPRKDGVLPQHDIRTDRFQLAMLATDRIHKEEATKRHNADFPQVLDENGKPIEGVTVGEA